MTKQFLFLRFGCVWRLLVISAALIQWAVQTMGTEPMPAALPASLQAVLDNAHPLPQGRGPRLPLYILPISDTLQGVADERAEAALSQLATRGIGYTVAWNPSARDQTVVEGVRIAKLARRAGLPVAVDASQCLYGFFDGDPATLHIDEQNHPFADFSFDPGRKMGCPFSLEQRIPMIRERFEFFLRRYALAGITIDFIFTDWEIDGPIEWNDAWANSKKCQRCRSQIKHLEDFREFQREIRAIRSLLQRKAFAQPVKSRFPRALVGNYAVYPNDGYRYWFDYYEKLPDGAPFVPDQKARYREWAVEFDNCRYTVAMPVVYTWYPIYFWYDFQNTDYRWFYNGLLVGSNAGKSTARSTPIVTFVHRTTTAPPPDPDPGVRPFSPALYRELLWHLLLRRHDSFFLWCMPAELAEETRLVHEVYSASLRYTEFFERGIPVTFQVPKTAGPVVSGLRLGKRVLVRRTDFDSSSESLTLNVNGQALKIPGGLKECRVLLLR